MNIYQQGLERCAANHVPLSPVSFVERSAEVFGDLPPWCTARAATPGGKPAIVPRGLPRRFAHPASAPALR